MTLDGLLREEERVGDLPVRVTARDVLGDLELATTERPEAFPSAGAALARPDAPSQAAELTRRLVAIPVCLVGSQIALGPVEQPAGRIDVARLCERDPRERPAARRRHGRVYGVRTIGGRDRQS